MMLQQDWNMQPVHKSMYYLVVLIMGTHFCSNLQRRAPRLFYLLIGSFADLSLLNSFDSSPKRFNIPALNKLIST